MNDQLCNDRSAAFSKAEAKNNGINYSWLISENSDFCFEPQMLVISIYPFICSWSAQARHQTLRDLSFFFLSVKNYSRPSPPVISSVNWQDGSYFLHEMAAGTTALVAERSTTLETEGDRHAVCWFLLLAQNKLSFTPVKIKFMIRRKQTSIYYLLRHYLSIAQSDRLRDL